MICLFSGNTVCRGKGLRVRGNLGDEVRQVGSDLRDILGRKSQGRQGARFLPGRLARSILRLCPLWLFCS